MLGSYNGRETTAGNSQDPWKAPLVTEIKVTEAELRVGTAQGSPQEKPVPNPDTAQDPHWGWRASTEGTELGIHLHFEDIRRSSSQPGLTTQPPCSTGRRRCTRANTADLGRPAARTQPRLPVPARHALQKARAFLGTQGPQFHA